MTTIIQPLQKRKFKKARFRSKLHAWIHKFFPKASTPFPSQEAIQQGNEKLKEAILSNAPFAAVRLSDIETQALQHYEAIQFGLQTSFPSPFFPAFQFHGGFYPVNEKQLQFYAKHVVKEAKKSDLFGFQGHPMEAYFASTYYADAKMIPYASFNPLQGDWLQLLEGKRVLVVSPFAEDIASQYRKRSLLFPKGVLPNFTLITVKAIQTQGQATDRRYATWFDGLDAMKVDVMQHDFDIALVGAGAYGSHLCWFIKTMGRQAIQTGGTTQLLFGLIGKRWENHPLIKPFQNANWIRPTEKPNGAEKIKPGGYW
jgi:hypothetical protein